MHLTERVASLQGAPGGGQERVRPSAGGHGGHQEERLLEIFLCQKTATFTGGLTTYLAVKEQLFID